jgi:hypothetical protein
VERSLEDFWACYLEPSGQLDSNYWEYFAERLAQLATIPTRATLLDIGTCDGSVLFKAMKKIKAQGYGTGIDIAYDDFYAGVNEAMQRGWGKKMPELDRFKEQIFNDLEQFQSPKGIHFVKTVGYAFGTKL